MPKGGNGRQNQAKGRNRRQRLAKRRKRKAESVKWVGELEGREAPSQPGKMREGKHTARLPRQKEEMEGRVSQRCRGIRGKRSPQQGKRRKRKAESVK